MIKMPVTITEEKSKWLVDVPKIWLLANHSNICYEIIYIQIITVSKGSLEQQDNKSFRLLLNLAVWMYLYADMPTACSYIIMVIKQLLQCSYAGKVALVVSSRK